MPTVREYEAAMERNPADTEAFVALRKAYRQAQKHDRLVTLYETRAQAIEDNAKAGELFYLAAELRIDQLGDAEGAEADLVNAVDRDPTHIRAAARLKDIYREQGRTADYMTMLEMEAAAVARTRDPARIAELEAEMSQLFLNHFAVWSARSATRSGPGKLAQEHVRSIESARKIYRALGDYRAVVRLYELELEGTQDARRRADLLLGLGRVLGEKLEELDAAAQRLAEVVRLRPRDEKALELLAGVYANPNWIGADGVDRAAAIYYQLARRRQEASDTDNAIAALRRALAAVPGHPESSELLERVYYDARPLPGAGSLLPRARRGGGDRAGAHRLPLQARAAGRGRAGGRRRGAARLQRDLAPGAGRAARPRRSWSSSICTARSTRSWPSCASGSWARSPIRSSAPGSMLELAALYRDRLGDRDQAAVYLHAVLEIEPENQMALGAYAEHFREKGDWAALADLLEFSFERARAGGHRRRGAAAAARGDRDRSARSSSATRSARIAAWQRAEEIAPDATRGRARRSGGCCSRARAGTGWRRCWSARRPRSPIRRSAPRSCAAPRRSTARSWARPSAPSRSTRTSCAPIRPTRCRCARVVETYEREGDFVSLAQLLREQIDRASTKQERVGLLRRVLVICDERTGDLVQGQWAANEILQAVPGDRDTLTRLERILERAGQPADLVRVLDQHTKHAANPDEKLQILHRIAEILRGPLQDPAGRGGAAGGGRPPRSRRRQGARRRWSADLHRAGPVSRIWPASWTCRSSAWSPIRRQQAEYLRQLARLVEGSAPRPRRARARPGSSCWICCRPTARRWTRWRASTPAEADWPTLVRIMERQMPLARGAGRAPSTSACSAPQIFDEKLHDTDAGGAGARAARSPRSIRATSVAHERLRSYYENDEDWPRVVKIAERQLFLTEDPALRGAAARWSWARWSATSWATTRRRSRSSSACWRWTPTTWTRCTRSPTCTSRPAITSGWRTPTRSCWNASPIPTSGAC